MESEVTLRQFFHGVANLLAPNTGQITPATKPPVSNHDARIAFLEDTIAKQAKEIKAYAEDATKFWSAFSNLLKSHETHGHQAILDLKADHDRFVVDVNTRLDRAIAKTISADATCKSLEKKIADELPEGSYRTLTAAIRSANACIAVLSKRTEHLRPPNKANPKPKRRKRS